MFQFVTGDILESTAECLVNTVNCEGYMGKGIAYQFKLKFPENNHDYIKACKSGKLRIGKIHYFHEKDKLIINFPTKDKWRAKSKLDYIHKGLAELANLLPELNIKSIAIPPLGCGNGGLNWEEVKTIIINYLSPFSDFIEIFVYEPSKYFRAKSNEAPKLNASHLVLMLFKLRLQKFNKIRLQKAAYFMNLFSKTNYFKFSRYKYGPYSHSLDILAKDIKQFQDFYKLNTVDALSLANSTLISKTVQDKIKGLSESIDEAADFINEVQNDKELELYATICSIMEQKIDLTTADIIVEIKSWSKEKADKFSDADILKATEFLLNRNLLEVNLMGSYNLKREFLTLLTATKEVESESTKNRLAFQ